MTDAPLHPPVHYSPNSMDATRALFVFARCERRENARHEQRPAVLANYGRLRWRALTLTAPVF
eukprot:6177111-Pleurochrysis_carterae.AAC.2